MSRMLLVVSDGISARLFGSRGLGLHYVHRIEPAEGRGQRRELDDGQAPDDGDLPGSSLGFAAHADPCDVEAVRFARRIAGFLDDEISSGSAREIALRARSRSRPSEEPSFGPHRAQQRSERLE